MSRAAGAVLAGALLVAVAHPVMAVEAGIGRSFAGAQITPYVGVIPPDPGVIASVNYFHIDGNVGTGGQVPIAGTAAVNLDADIDVAAASIAYVWDTGMGQWNFASVVALPFDDVEVTGDVALGPASVRRTDQDSGLFDMLFVPVQASYHASPVDHWSFGLYVSAPTGSYTAGQLANNSLNYWTFAPGVGYTHLFGEGTLEFSTLAAFDINTTNDATDYRSGTVFRLDAMLTKRFANGWSAGLVGGLLEQVSDDSGTPLADQLDGFRGHAYGLGPSLGYTRNFSGTSSLGFAFRYVVNLDAKKQLDGDPLLLSVSYNP